MVVTPNSICPAFAECHFSVPTEPPCGALPEHAPITAVAAPGQLCGNALRGVAERRITAGHHLEEKAWSSAELALITPDPIEAETHLVETAQTLDAIEENDRVPWREKVEAKLLGAYLGLLRHQIRGTDPSRLDFVDLRRSLGFLLEEVTQNPKINDHEKGQLQGQIACFYLLAREEHGDIRPASPREKGKFAISKTERHAGYLLGEEGKTPFRVSTSGKIKDKASSVYGLNLGGLCNPEELYRLIILETKEGLINDYLRGHLSRVGNALYDELKTAEYLNHTPAPFWLAEQCEGAVPTAENFPGGRGLEGWTKIENGLQSADLALVKKGLSILREALQPDTFETAVATRAGFAHVFHRSFYQRARNRELGTADLSTMYYSLAALIKRSTEGHANLPESAEGKKNYAAAVGMLGYLRCAIQEKNPSLLVVPSSPRELRARPIDGVRYAHDSYQITPDQRKRPFNIRFKRQSDSTRGYHPNIVNVFVGDLAERAVRTAGPALAEAILNAADPTHSKEDALVHICRLLCRDGRGEPITDENAAILQRFCELLKEVKAKSERQVG